MATSFFKKAKIIGSRLIQIPVDTYKSIKEQCSHLAYLVLTERASVRNVEFTFIAAAAAVGGGIGAVAGAGFWLSAAATWPILTVGGGILSGVSRCAFEIKEDFKKLQQTQAPTPVVVPEPANTPAPKKEPLADTFGKAQSPAPEAAKKPASEQPKPPTP